MVVLLFRVGTITDRDSPMHPDILYLYRTHLRNLSSSLHVHQLRRQHIHLTHQHIRQLTHQHVHQLTHQHVCQLTHHPST
jgi:hypothetical protein